MANEGNDKNIFSDSDEMSSYMENSDNSSDEEDPEEESERSNTPPPRSHKQVSDDGMCVPISSTV